MPTDLEKRFRVMRLVGRIMLVAVVLYAWVAEKLASGKLADHDLKPSFLVGLVCVAFVFGIASLVTGVAARRAGRKLIIDSAAPGALYAWSIRHMLAFSLALSVALFGLVLRFMGASLFWSIHLYAACALLLLVATPPMPQVGPQQASEPS